MPVDSTIPTGATKAAELAALVQEDRKEINRLWVALLVGRLGTYSEVSMAPGDTAFSATARLSVGLQASAPVNLETITSGFSGQFLIVRAQDDNVTVKNASGNIYLSVEDDFHMIAGDVIMLLNIGGDIESGISGTWYEFSRTLWK